MKMPPYLTQHVLNSYRWFGHQGFTELNAIPSKTGGDNESKGDAFPKIWYAKHEGDVLGFVKKYYAEHMVCYGINPRPKILKMPMGSPRSARESEIAVSQNLVFDFDLVGDEKAYGRLDALDAFLKRADEYFLDLHLRPPVKAFTGQGYHLLFAFPPIEVKECSDIGERLKHFREDFRDAYREELADLETKLDSTQDLRRMVRIYGTAKPSVGIVSRFYGGERIEDERLKAYLLELQLQEERNFVLRPAGELPSWFEDVLQTDTRTRELWAGTGKSAGTDTSRSGYDYSLALRLLHLGYKNIDELATVLVLRPEGSVQKSGKGEAYVRRTIANALLRPVARHADMPTDGIEKKLGV